MNRPPSPFTMLLSRHTRRREFITLLGGAAAAWPLAARAQQAERMRRIGVLMPASRGRSGIRRPASRRSCKGCSELGWIDGRNVRIDYRWGAGRCRAPFASIAAELVALAPDVILAHRQRDRGAAAAGDPHRADRVRECRRSGRRRLRRKPGAAGRQRHRVHHVRIRLGGKWLELLKEIAPRVTRAAVLRDPAIAVADRPIRQPSSRWRRRSGWSCARSMCATPARSSAPSRPSRGSPNGGLIVTASALACVHIAS